MMEIENNTFLKTCHLFGYDSKGLVVPNKDVIGFGHSDALLILAEIMNKRYFQFVIQGSQQKRALWQMALVRDESTVLLSILLRADFYQLADFDIQKNLMNFFMMLCKNLCYTDDRITLVNSLFLQFFGASHCFDMRLAPQLAAFCVHEHVTIQAVFDNLRADTRNGFPTGEIVKRLAAALIYDSYQDGKSNHIGTIFCGGNAKQTRQSQDHIAAVLAASQCNDYFSLDQAFKDLGLPADTADVIVRAMAGHSYVHLNNVGNQADSLHAPLMKENPDRGSDLGRDSESDFKH